MTNTNKIASLPRPIRDQINHRLLNQEPAESIIKWLHTLTDVWRIIRQQFNNQNFTTQDLSEWRLTGYAEWKLQQNYGPDIPNPELSTGGQLNTSARRVVDHLMEVIAGCFAQFIHHWNGDVTPEFNAKLRALSHLTRDICALRKSEYQAAKLRLEEAKFAARQKQSDEAMDAQFMKLLDQPGIREQVLAHYANPPAPAPRPKTPDPSFTSPSPASRLAPRTSGLPEDPAESDLIKPNQGLPGVGTARPHITAASVTSVSRPTPLVNNLHPSDDSSEAPDIYSRPNQTKSSLKPQKEEPIVSGFRSPAGYDADLRRNDVHY